VKFRAKVELGGVAKLGSSKRPAVSATINRYTYRSTVAPMGGRFMLPVSAQVREAAGVAAGGQPYYGGPYAAPNCWMENRSAWNGYQWIVQPVQVCPW